MYCGCPYYISCVYLTVSRLLVQDLNSGKAPCFRQRRIKCYYISDRRRRWTLMSVFTTRLVTIVDIDSAYFVCTDGLTFSSVPFLPRWRQSYFG